MEQQLKTGDKVLIIDAPVTDCYISNADYQSALHTCGIVDHVYKYGERNIIVRWGKYGALNYCNSKHLQLIKPVNPIK